MSDQLSKFPLAAAIVAQTMLDRWEQARAEGYVSVVGKMLKNLSAAEELIKHNLYGDDNATKEDESAYKLRLWCDDPGVFAFMEIEWVGVFQITKHPAMPFLKPGNLQDRVKFIVTNILTNDLNIFNDIPYEEYVDGMSNNELELMCSFVDDNFRIIASCGGIMFEGYNAAYDDLSGPGKVALQKLIVSWD